jgi:hypothetical protein
MEISMATWMVTVEICALVDKDENTEGWTEKSGSKHQILRKDEVEH